MTTARKNPEGKAQQNPAVLFDSFETSVIHSTDVIQLDTAYDHFRALPESAQIEVLLEAGPARAVSLALRGYELPDLPARIASAKFLANVLDLVGRKEVPKPLQEQINLILAQQRSVLLEAIEQDLESLQSTALPRRTAGEWNGALTELYTHIRSKSHRAIRQLFSTNADVHAQLSLSEAM